MLSLLMALVPFLPEVMKLFKNSQDNRQELALVDKQIQLQELKGNQTHALQAANNEVLLTLQDQLTAMQETASARAMYSDQKSFGVQLIDKLSAMPNISTAAWLPVWYAFAVLDLLRGAVVPVIALFIVGNYIYMKQATFQAIGFGDYDYELLTAIISFYLGNRVRKAVFGGGTDNSVKGG
ncbi:hypothetical protein UFOVP435_24 [uncultured Caudovirales phage]|uniref:Holin of 3TMs, for gene-transfer release n=1 Tax=uncultured Caudovirales phage TaxID=2100421 RepID=A0A6J5MGC9_9CAUD|nr:hypothetical protein UFOVP435_24 [uncultured Caudovirales phage]